MNTTDDSKATTLLGDCLGSFKPMLGNIIAGFILSLLLIGAGVVGLTFVWREVYLAGGDLPLHVQKGMGWSTVALGSVLAAGAIVGGIVLARYSRWLLSHGVDVCADGFCYRVGASGDNVRWSEVASIRETVLYERPPLLKGAAKLLLPKMKSRSFLVTTKAGKDYSFDGNSVKGINRFAELLRKQADRFTLPWDIVEQHA
jgi:hypothetical protein